MPELAAQTLSHTRAGLVSLAGGASTHSRACVSYVLSRHVKGAFTEVNTSARVLRARDTREYTAVEIHECDWTTVEIHECDWTTSE